MMQPDPECPVCRVRMEEGHVLEMGDNHSLRRVTWIEGEPEKGMLGGFKVRGKRQIPTLSYRCPRCGWLLWFAPEAGGSS